MIEGTQSQASQFFDGIVYRNNTVPSQGGEFIFLFPQRV